METLTYLFIYLFNNKIKELNNEAEIVKVDFTKSVIQSKASLTYEQAQLRIDDL